MDCATVGVSENQSTVTPCPSDTSDAPTKPSHITPADVASARGRFTGSAIDWASACTATRERGCRIVRHLAVWNEFLLHSRLELRESCSSRGHSKLSLVTTDEHNWPLPDEDELHVSATLVNVLLKTHHCVTCVALNTGPLRAQVDLLGDALRGNNSCVKSLSLVFESFQSDRSVWRALPSLLQLEELECASTEECPDEFLDAVSALLVETKSLTALRMSALRIVRRGYGPLFMGRPSRLCPRKDLYKSCEDLVVVDHDMKNYVVERFVHALKRNSSVRELSLNESVVSEVSHEAFVGYLTNNSGPLSAFRVVAADDSNRFSADRILMALMNNATVSKLALIGLYISDCCSLLVQRILGRHRTLRSFELSVRNYYWSGRLNTLPRRMNFDSWLVTLAQNDSLEEVTLKFEMAYVFSEPEKWQVFAKELPKRKNLKKVTIDASREAHFLSAVCRMLSLNGVEDKVSFPAYNVQGNVDLLECRSFSGIYACLFGSPEPQFYHLFSRLPSFYHITTLHLDVWISSLEETLSRRIVECIESTTSIKKLRLISSLRDAPTSDYWVAIIAALSRNDSVRELQVQARVQDPEHADALARVAKASVKIGKVHFVVGGTVETAALVRRLSSGIENSYNLVSVTLDGQVDAEVIGDWFAVRQVTRRNSSIVTRATRFLAAEECCDGFDAAALEQVSRHPELLTEIADQLVISEADAKAKVRRKLREFEDLHSFMRLAGVVNSRVECHRNHDDGAQTQLENLNEYCWLHVRQYLTLDDIGEHGHTPTSQ
ncbi:hypothetical protein HPB50_008748 [Hyalomma asiaticum]|uniref:Uncharacterized protein n=1 Tax=Hyalomma asiaticum TaxID=266040 RepID=A0ACB7T929_HYAAI|nr:hypothetical protein HPB50_008748 [Hyalomma asiaticum]